MEKQNGVSKVRYIIRDADNGWIVNTRKRNEDNVLTTSELVFESQADMITFISEETVRLGN